MNYALKPNALRNLKKLPRSIQKRILDKLDFYVRSDNPLTFAESLRDEVLGEFRFRIGDYRVAFDLVDNLIVVLKIGHRRDFYK